MNTIQAPLQVVNDKGIAVEANKVLRGFRLDSLPTLDVALKDLKYDIENDEYADIPTEVDDIGMDGAGQLILGVKDSGHQYARPSRKALGDVLGFLDVPRGTLDVLTALSPSARAHAFIDFMQQNKGKRQKVVARTAWDSTGNARYVRAFVSPTHSRETGDDLQVIQALRQSFSATAHEVKARVVRSLLRTDIEVFVPSTQALVKKGDPVIAKVHIVNSEVRAFGFSAMGGLLRLICTNGMTRVDEATTQRVIHRGDVSWRLKTAIDGSYTGVAPLLQDFTAASTARLAAPREDIVSRLQAATRGRFPATVWEGVPHVWDVDGELSAGDTVAGVANALTRVSQGYDYATAADIETFAGELLSPDSIAYRAIAA